MSEEGTRNLTWEKRASADAAACAEMARSVDVVVCDVCLETLKVHLHKHLSTIIACCVETR